MSPRLMGEAAYLGGRAASPLKALGAIPHPVAAGNVAFQTGRMSQVAQSAPAEYAVKQLSSALSQNDAATLNATRKSGTPLADKIMSPLEKFGKAAVSAKGSPTPGNIAKLSGAARNLVSNLEDLGIHVTPDQLIGTVTKPDSGQR